MVSMVIFDKKEEELLQLLAEIKALAAKLTEDYWKIKTATSLPEALRAFHESSLVDLSCYDVTMNETLDKLVEIRKEFAEMGLLLIADMSISPLAYLRPSIKADALLIRPFNKEDIVDILTEFLLAHFKTLENKYDKFYVIESKEGRINIPYEKIYYFEAREKKIFIRTRNEEFGFYTTLEQISEVLPDNFIRCHRSFIVNSDKVSRIKLSANYIILSEEFEIPLSRSYKPIWKEFGKKYGTGQ